MNKTDKAIKEKMQIEYKNITPDMDKLIMATEQEHKSVKRQKSGWKKYVAAAAIFAIIISMAGSSTIRAFLLDIYERYFIKTQQIFEENTEAYIKNLDLEYDIEGEKVIIKQYVVTDTGIDFKICQDDESKIKICGCELKTKNGESYDEMVVRLKDYYIVSNVIKDSRWTEEDESTINILYLKEGQEDVYTAEKKVKLDTSDVYYNKTIQGKPLIISDDKYNVSRIILATWYMKIDYDVDEQMSGDYVPIIKQGGEELLAYLTAVENKGGCSAYYQHPEVDKPIEIALGKFDYEKNTIDEMSEYMKIELKNILKEDR